MRTMKRVVVDHYGGPEVLKVVEDDVPRPGPGEVRVRVLAAGVSFTDAQLRAGTYLPGAPKPPFTPGYELVGVVEELGPDCSRLRVGDRIGALTVWAPTLSASACRSPAQSTFPRTSTRGRS
jgi:NADPH2:quinone reductase